MDTAEVHWRSFIQAVENTHPSPEALLWVHRMTLKWEYSGMGFIWCTFLSNES